MCVSAFRPSHHLPTVNSLCRLTPSIPATATISVFPFFYPTAAPSRHCSHSRGGQPIAVSRRVGLGSVCWLRETCGWRWRLVDLAQLPGSVALRILLSFAASPARCSLSAAPQTRLDRFPRPCSLLCRLHLGAGLLDRSGYGRLTIPEHVESYLFLGYWGCILTSSSLF